MHILTSCLTKLSPYVLGYGQSIRIILSKKWGTNSNLVLWHLRGNGGKMLRKIIS